VNRSFLLAGVAGLVACVSGALASSHGEAPYSKVNPKTDATDFYMFNSYEAGRDGFVTIVANFYPLQDAYSGPNYFTLDPDALYQIHIDNDGNAAEDLTFSFRVATQNRDIAIDVGGVMVSVPLVAVGPVGDNRDATANLNVVETYSLDVIRGERSGPGQPVTDAATGSAVFKKPVDNIGTKTIPNYAAYAADHVYTVRLPGSNLTGRVFVGQRKDPFVVNLGETFDLVNLNPLGPENGRADKLADKNITSFIMEIPASYLRRSKSPDPVIGGWMSASLPRARVLLQNPTFARPAAQAGTHVQVSRLGMPLVNEVVIGLKDKNLFNASVPKGDGQFAAYVTNPTLPTILASLFPVAAPCTPRNDLVQVFLTGVPGLNQPVGVTGSEMLRLNTNTDASRGGIPAKPKGQQNRLGVIAGDLAGFPNGRRPGDDVVDVALRVVMGALLPPDCAPNGNLPYTDGAFLDDSFFSDRFPYLVDPLPGATGG
jgi:hypothetical protein